jgi:hypothetical protein
VTGVLPNLISLTPDAVADAVAEWLTKQVAGDTRAYGVCGPIDGRVILLLKGGGLLLIDVNPGEVMIA